MNKLLLLGLLGFVLLAVAGADTEQKTESELSTSEQHLQRQTRGAVADGKRTPAQKKRGKKGNKQPKKDKKKKPRRKNSRISRQRKRQQQSKGKKKKIDKKKKKKRVKHTKRQHSQRTSKGKKGSRRPACSRQSKAVTDTCLDRVVKFLNFEKTVIKNFLAQKTRITRHNKTGASKSGKKGTFSPVLSRLVSSGGGNRSNMSCQGSTTSAGALQLTNLSATLLQCEVNINTSCNPANGPLPSNHSTVADACNVDVVSFLNITATCAKLSSDAACTCWSDTALDSLSATIKTNCSLAAAATSVALQKKMCLGNFSICRKFEDDVITAISSCSESTSDLLTKAKNLQANSDAMTAAKTTAAAKVSGRFSARRSSRAVPTTCAEMITLLAALLTAAGEFSSSPSIATMATDIANTSSTVTCSAAEKASLSTQITSLDAAISVMADEISTLSETISAQTGSTPSASQIAEGGTTASVTTTAASGRNRRALLQSVLKHKKF